VGLRWIEDGIRGNHDAWFAPTLHLFRCDDVLTGAVPEEGQSIKPLSESIPSIEHLAQSYGVVWPYQIHALHVKNHATCRQTIDFLLRRLSLRRPLLPAIKLTTAATVLASPSSSHCILCLFPVSHAHLNSEQPQPWLLVSLSSTWVSSINVSRHRSLTGQPQQYTMYGHIAKLAEAEKKGIESAGGKVDVYRYDLTADPTRHST
jgi:hypothetical protein